MKRRALFTLAAAREGLDGHVPWRLQREDDGHLRIDVPTGSGPSARVLRVLRPQP